MPEEGDAGEHQPIEKERVIDWRIKAGLAIGVVIALVAAAVVLSGALNPRPGDANLPPRAMFTAEPLLAKVGQVVRFNGSASADADGKIANYSWNFSDGSSTSGVEVEHSFAGTGAYDVTLTVKDDKGATDSATAEIKVVPADNLAPTARIKASAASVGVGIPVVFDGSYSNDSDGIIKTYAWDFGDGGISNESRVAHAFKSKGSYLVSLLVEDDRGAPDSDQVAVNVTVPNLPPVAVLGTNRTNATVMSPVLFDSSNSSDPDGTIAGQDWDLGDGNRSTAKQLSHAYERPGNYTVRLAVRDDMGATANASVQVVVFLPPANSPPVAKPQADRSSAKVGEKFSFNGSASFDTDGTVVSHQWDFGDGTSATGALAEHAYASPGLFTVLLTVTDDKGAKGSDSLAVSVGTSSTKQSATFRAYPPVAFVGENVTFDACESGDLANATELRWDHGDGTRQNVTAPVCVAKHSYSAKGQMNVSLEIAYLGGNLSRANRTVGIYVPLGGGASSVYSDAFYPAGDTLDPASEYSAYA
ncbi:MAG TPA: PKD domain-containing protein, partial [Thermoplasmata archaeon]|nr:PKD domain-containing protein [Thermoplasmata archaeon]